MPRVYAIDGITPVVLGEDAVVAALAFVKAEDSIPARSLAVGIPGSIPLSELKKKHG